MKTSVSYQERGITKNQSKDIPYMKKCLKQLDKGEGLKDVFI